MVDMLSIAGFSDDHLGIHDYVSWACVLGWCHLARQLLEMHLGSWQRDVYWHRHGGNRAY